MKRSKIIGLLLVLLLPVFVMVGVARAQTFRSGDTATVAAGEVVDSTLYAAGSTVDIAGEVQGDVFCAGQNISITGKVTGDVICAGQTVHISGIVEGDVRAAGQTVSVGGEVMGNLSVGSQTFTLEGSAKVGGDATVGGEQVVLNGSIGRDLVSGSSNVTVAGSVGRNIKAGVEHLNLTGEATVGGALSYTSANEASIADGATVAGNTTRTEPEQKDTGNRGTVFGFGLAMAFYVLLSLLIVSLVLVLVFPQAFQRASVLALADPFKSFLVGLGATFVVPALIVGFMISLVGIPLSLLLLLAWMLVLFLSGPVFAFTLGRLVLRGQTNAILIMAVGSLIVLASYLIPFLGVFTLLATLWVGTGTIIRTLHHHIPKPAYELATQQPTKAKK